MAKIVLVDDEVEIAEMIGGFLRMEGYEVEVAHTVEEGVAKIKSHCPELVLLDVKLDGGSGVEVLRRIKDNPKNCHCKVLMVSGASEDEYWEEARALGAAGRVRKPVLLAGLKETIEKTLQKR